MVVDKETCMGCKYCLMGCPYGARYTVEEWESYFPDGLQLSPYEEFAKQAFEEKSGIGVATKCDFCLDRLAEGKEPSCVAACQFSGAISPESPARPPPPWLPLSRRPSCSTITETFSRLIGRVSCNSVPSGRRI